MRRIDQHLVRRELPPRNRSAHKGDFGHLLLIGGGPGMSGAIRLSGEAALRVGAGRVSIATHPSHANEITAGRPELMCHGIASATDLEALLDRVDTLAIGPGLGSGAWAESMWQAALAADLPMVVDADALNILATTLATGERWILTPHPGEAARLLSCSTQAVQNDRPAALNKIVQTYGGVAVLKGAGTLVSAEDTMPWLCAGGNPGMAAAGMGDVLTGIIGGLLAQGLTPELAAVIGVSVHAEAGDRAAAGGERGLIASDLFRELRACVNP
jgi:NAD(P)H-hydrate epimerase